MSETDQTAKPGNALTGCLVVITAITACVGACVTLITPSENERTAERRSDREAAEQALSGSAIEEGVLSFEAYSGTLDVTANPALAGAWEASTCETQRANVSALFEKWRYRYGDEAHTVILRSSTGREIGKYSKLWGYHCE